MPLFRKEDLIESNQGGGQSEPKPWTSQMHDQPIGPLNPVPWRVRMAAAVRSAQPRIDFNDDGSWSTQWPVEIPQRQLGYVPTYWEDPKRVAQWYETLRTLPEGTPVPYWVDRDNLKLAYDYLRLSNKGAPSNAWRFPNAEDPVRGFLQGLKTPPVELMRPAEAKYVPPAKQPGEMQALEMPRIGSKEYGELPLFQQVLLPLFRAGEVAPNPEWAQVLSEELGLTEEEVEQIWTATASGGTMGAIFGSAFAPGAGTLVGGGAGLVLGGGSASAQAFLNRWERVQPGMVAPGGGMHGFYTALRWSADNVGMVLAWPAQIVEQFLGTTAQAVYSSVDPEKYGSMASLGVDPLATWKAGASLFEGAPLTGVTPGGAEPGKSIWIAGKPDPEQLPPELQTSDGWEALGIAMRDARQLLMEHPEMTTWEVSAWAAERFGFSSILQDMVFQGILDPLNAAGPESTRAIKKWGEVTGNPHLVRAADQAMRMKRTGAARTFQVYQTILKTTVPPERIAHMGRFARWLGGVTSEGKLSILETPDTKLGRLFGLTPRARAVEILATGSDGLKIMMGGRDESVTFPDALRRLAALANTDGKWAEDTSLKVFDSPDGMLVVLMARDFGAEWADGNLKVYAATEVHRSALQVLSELVGMDRASFLDELERIGAPEMWKRVQQEVQAARTPAAEQAKLMLDTWKISEKTLMDLVEVFTGPDAIPWHEEMWKAKLYDAWMEHEKQWVVQHLGVEVEGTVGRMADVMKSIYSLALLDLNPKYAIANGLNNLVTMVVDRNIDPQIMGRELKWLDRFGVAPMRLAQSFGGAGGIMEGVDIQALRAGQREALVAAGHVADVRAMQGVSQAAKGGGGLVTAERWIHNLRGKVGLASKAAARMERASSVHTTTAAIKQWWTGTWRRDVGYRAMPPDLERLLGPDVSSAVYGLIDGAMNQDELAAALNKRTVNRPPEAFLDDVAADLGATPQQVREAVAQSGFLDYLNERLPGVKTREQLLSVFLDWEQARRDYVESLLPSDSATLIGEAASQAAAGDWMGALDLYYSINRKVADWWTQHVLNMSDMMAQADEMSDPAMRNALISAQMQAAQAEWGRMRQLELSAYEGIERGLRGAPVEVDGPLYRGDLEIYEGQQAQRAQTGEAYRGQMFTPEARAEAERLAGGLRTGDRLTGATGEVRRVEVQRNGTIWLMELDDAGKDVPGAVSVVRQGDEWNTGGLNTVARSKIRREAGGVEPPAKWRELTMQRNDQRERFFAERNRLWHDFHRTNFASGKDRFARYLGILDELDQKYRVLALEDVQAQHAMDLAVVDVIAGSNADAAERAAVIMEEIRDSMLELYEREARVRRVPTELYTGERPTGRVVAAKLRQIFADDPALMMRLEPLIASFEVVKGELMVRQVARRIYDLYVQAIKMPAIADYYNLRNDAVRGSFGEGIPMAERVVAPEVGARADVAPRPETVARDVVEAAKPEAVTSEPVRHADAPALSDLRGLAWKRGRIPTATADGRRFGAHLVNWINSAEGLGLKQQGAPIRRLEQLTPEQVVAAAEKLEQRGVYFDGLEAIAKERGLTVEALRALDNWEDPRLGAGTTKARRLAIANGMDEGTADLMQRDDLRGWLTARREGRPYERPMPMSVPEYRRRVAAVVGPEKEGAWWGIQQRLARSRGMTDAEYIAHYSVNDPGGMHAYYQARGMEHPAVVEAVEYFGITDNPHEAGYLLPDGRFLDLSGRHWEATVETEGRKLSTMAEIKTNMQDADFWIVRRGSPDTVGTVTKTYNAEHFGVKVTGDVLLPDYAYYMMMALQQKGYYRNRMKGTLRLQHITLEDIRNIGVQVRPDQSVAPYIRQGDRWVPNKNAGARAESNYANTRNVDHSEPEGALVSLRDSNLTKFDWMRDAGVIRWSWVGTSLVVEIGQKPTRAQMRQIEYHAALAARSGSDVVVEVWRGDWRNPEARLEYDQWADQYAWEDLVDKITDVYPDTLYQLPENVMRDPAFAAAFEGSQAVDEAGRPKVMYLGVVSGEVDHFTRSNMTDQGRMGLGFEFTDDPELAGGQVRPTTREFSFDTEQQARAANKVGYPYFDAVSGKWKARVLDYDLVQPGAAQRPRPLHIGIRERGRYVRAVRESVQFERLARPQKAIAERTLRRFILHGSLTNLLALEDMGIPVRRQLVTNKVAGAGAVVPAYLLAKDVAWFDRPATAQDAARILDAARKLYRLEGEPQLEGRTLREGLAELRAVDLDTERPFGEQDYGTLLSTAGYQAASDAFKRANGTTGRRWTVYDKGDVRSIYAPTHEVGGRTLYQLEESGNMLNKGFYLLSQRLIEKKLAQAMPVEQLRNWLKGKGVKAEEMYWTGLDEWLTRRAERAGPVTPQELRGYFERNPFVIEEVHYPGLRINEYRNPLGSRKTWVEVRPEDGPLPRRTWESEVEGWRGAGSGKLRIVEERIPSHLSPEDALTYANSLLGREPGTSWDGAAVYRLEMDRRQLAVAETLERVKALAENRLDWEEREAMWPSVQMGPGGEQYHEIVLRFPRQIREVGDFFKWLAAKDSGWAAGEESWLWRTASDDVRAQLRQKYESEILSGDAATEVGPYVSGLEAHKWGESNIVVWVRGSEFTDDMGRRVFVIDEVQSDWHEKGRKYGYLTEEERGRLADSRRAGDKAETDKTAAAGDLIAWARDSVDAERYVALFEFYEAVTHSEGPTAHELREYADDWLPGMVDQARALAYAPHTPVVEAGVNILLDPEVLSLVDRFDAARSRHVEAANEYRALESQVREMVPAGPWSDDYGELAFKRAAMWAAQKGYDVLAWTTGERQAERWMKHGYADMVLWARQPDRDGKAYYQVVLTRASEGKPAIRLRIGDDDLETYFGKNVAQRIRAEEGREALAEPLTIRAFWKHPGEGGERMAAVQAAQFYGSSSVPGPDGYAVWSNVPLEEGWRDGYAFPDVERAEFHMAERYGVIANAEPGLPSGKLVADTPEGKVEWGSRGFHVFYDDKFGGYAKRFANTFGGVVGDELVRVAPWAGRPKVEPYMTRWRVTYKDPRGDFQMGLREVHFDTREAADVFADGVYGQNQEFRARVHSVELNDKARSSVLTSGMSLFQLDADHPLRFRLARAEADLIQFLATHGIEAENAAAYMDAVRGGTGLTHERAGRFLADYNGWKALAEQYQVAKLDVSLGDKLGRAPTLSDFQAYMREQYGEGTLYQLAPPRSLLAGGDDGIWRVMVDGREVLPFKDRALAERVVRALNGDGVTDMAAPKPKGAASPLQDSMWLVQFFDGADFSTVVHEGIHVFSSLLKPEEVEVVKAWQKATHGADIDYLDGRFVGDEAQVRQAQEDLARGFERYLAEGKAPTSELAGLFERLRQWLLEIYRSIAGSKIDVNLTPEVRQMFDKMLVDPQELARAEQQAMPLTERPQDVIPKPPPAQAATGAMPDGRILTLSGREIPWPPLQSKAGKPLKIETQLQRMDLWLWEQARNEVAARKWPQDSLVESFVEGMNPKRLSPADRTTLNEVLFGVEEIRLDRQAITEAQAAKADRFQGKRFAVEVVEPQLRDKGNQEAGRVEWSVYDLTDPNKTILWRTTGLEDANSKARASDAWGSMELALENGWKMPTKKAAPKQDRAARDRARDGQDAGLDRKSAEKLADEEARALAEDPFQGDVYAVRQVEKRDGTTEYVVHARQDAAAILAAYPTLEQANLRAMSSDAWGSWAKAKQNKFRIPGPGEAEAYEIARAAARDGIARILQEAEDAASAGDEARLAAAESQISEWEKATGTVLTGEIENVLLADLQAGQERAGIETSPVPDSWKAILGWIDEAKSKAEELNAGTDGMAQQAARAELERRMGALHPEAGLRYDEWHARRDAALYYLNGTVQDARQLLAEAERTLAEWNQAAPKDVPAVMLESKVLNRIRAKAEAKIRSGQQMPGIEGSRTTAHGPDPNVEYEFRYRVLELDDLIVSHNIDLEENPAYPRELQPRGRDRAAGRAQVENIVAGFNPKGYLEISSRLDDASPIIGPDLLVESGNGRSIVLQRVRAENPEAFARYRNQLITNAAEYGLDPSSIDAMTSPVLVRERLTELNPAEREVFVRVCNESTAARMSPAEQARMDAGAFHPDTLALLEIGDTQTFELALRSPRNRLFVDNFLANIPETERGQFFDEAGQISGPGIRRVLAAVLARTFAGDSGSRLAVTLTETADINVRNLASAIVGALGDLARSEALVEAGRRPAELSIVEDIAVATNKLATLRAEGAMSASEYLQQGQMFGRELTPFQEQLLLDFESFKSARQAREVMKAYAQLVRQQPDVGQAGLFGDVEYATKVDLWARSKRGPQETLFQLPEGTEMGPQDAIPPEVLPGELSREGVQNITPIIQTLRDKMLEPGGYFKESALNLDGLPVDGQRMLTDWLTGVKSDMASTKMGALRWGATMRDMTLLNYNNRRGFSGAATLGWPYYFWPTETALRWGLRAIDRPAMLANYYRLRQKQKMMDEIPGWPTRLKTKMEVPIPFMPDWMGGGVFIDPLNQMFPPVMFEQNINRFVNGAERDTTGAARVLGDWVESGRVSEQDAKIAAVRGGPLWDKALQQAQADNQSTAMDPFDFISTMTGFALPIEYARQAWRGTPENIGPLPATRMIKTATAALGLGPPGGINIEAPIRRALNLPEYDKFEAYRVDRMLATMTAEGAIEPDEALMAQMERKGDIYDQALRRVEQVRLMGGFANPLYWIGFPGDIFPKGEEHQRALGLEWKKAYQAYANGDVEALDSFLDKFPEYRVRLAAFDDPQERLKSYLVDEVWLRYRALDPVNKQLAVKQLGTTFELTFLDKETRNYQDLDIQTLSLWARALGGIVPNTKETDFELPMGMQAPEVRVLPPALAKEIQDYKEWRNREHPYWYALQTRYYDLPPGAQRRQFLAMFPQLKTYWTDNKGYLAQHPNVKQWQAGLDVSDAQGEEVGHLTMPEILTNPLLMRQLYGATFAGQQLTSGALQELERIHSTTGQEEDFGTWLQSVMVPLGQGQQSLTPP